MYKAITDPEDKDDEILFQGISQSASLTQNEDLMVLRSSSNLKQKATGPKRPKIHSFFMTKKQKIEQALIEKSIKLQSRVMASKIVTAKVSEGKTLNPFFNPVESKVEKGHKVSMQSIMEAEIPSKLNFHVGWVKNQHFGMMSDRPWKNSSVPKSLESLSEFRPAIVSEAPKPYLVSAFTDDPEEIIQNLKLEYGESLQSSWNQSNYGKLCGQNTLQKDSQIPWVEKYKPAGLDEIIGDSRLNLVKDIISHLSDWRPPSKSTILKKPKKVYDDDDDFIDDDDQICSCPPLIILNGPCGSGKNAIVNIVANQLKYNIFEVNVSQKRNGKVISETIGNASCFQTMKRPNIFSKAGNPEPTKTLILLDDVDYLMEEDKGFWAAISSVITTAKCPIILTCSNDPLTSNNPSISCFETLARNSKVYYLDPPQKCDIKPYISIITCLEGYWVDNDILDEACNGGLRSAICNLQMVCSETTRSKFLKVAKPKDVPNVYTDISEALQMVEFNSKLDIFNLEAAIDIEPIIAFDEMVTHAPLLAFPSQINRYQELPLNIPTAPDISNPQIFKGLVSHLTDFLGEFHLPRLSIGNMHTLIIPFLSRMAKHDQPKPVESARKTRNSDYSSEFARGCATCAIKI